ncbi:hypothetical protein VCUG_01887 [Vavraia culicis subsp. floridensis]|uniref:DNA-directed RNA polymerase I, II, and III subunit RPABC2 n=1 Tax=Vavraia culicis (isolate floridensis) TaxID=948595 RepID=L2GSL5_VAVCU|nr:uncharacterized protein VCUG_01887 [Vavraia culicis subsp. floridensis]ELA46661.1 hypothetical protein VCUG_01887 [Vavraia culicis subsp. floridensis]
MDYDHHSESSNTETVIIKERPPSPPKKSSRRVTSSLMTKYEKTRIIGMRAMQLSMNAPPLVEIEGETDALRIAEKEFYARKIPFIVRRRLPDNTYEDWSINELVYPDEEIDFSRYEMKG